jgi:tetratricopeptide (TPR) repeat protein
MAGEGVSGHPVDPSGFYGSRSCRDCHEVFYEKWATSHHGLAMQPFTPEFARTQLLPPTGEMRIGEFTYLAEIEGATAYVCERSPGSEQRYPIAHALGGKNLYYFLTPLDRGRLQVLPLAFDVDTKEWFDTTASMVRHFGDRPDGALDWRERPLTFNTSCYNCHVSQLSTNYDLETDTYQTTWTEPGINCETCHGPGGEHVRVCLETPPGQVPDDLKIILTSVFTPQQTNAMCAPCHAKMMPITNTFMPGDRFFDHYGLVTLEDPDFYPDGRDLGENYTETLWRMSPCVESGELHCVHCHTSSGRNRHTGAEADNACLPCHEEYVTDPAAHSHHLKDSSGSRCVLCHMPETVFARMRRHDHSMLPPTPATTLEFESPNACNLCHTDRDAAWADRWVREWYADDYQAEVLHRTRLIDSARKRNRSHLERILEYLSEPDKNEIVVTSLIRLLEDCADERKWPIIRRALGNPSPLVRASAVTALGQSITAEVRDALLECTSDEYRLVRVQAASALSAYPRELLPPPERERLELASTEYEASLKCRPDDHASHYNLGNYYLNRGDLSRALEAFQTSFDLQPDSILPLVNASIVHARLGQTEKAEASLRKALAAEPANAAANFNLGLLMGEKGQTAQAERYLRKALDTDPKFAEAAYNLGVLIASRDLEEAVYWCGQASKLRPNDPKCAYTFAYFLNQFGEPGRACEVLEETIRRSPEHPDAYGLLGMIYEEQREVDKAKALYRKAVANDALPENLRYRFDTRLRSLVN